MSCSEAERFIVKTTLWFDVLASACQAQVPVFIEEIRELFDPTNARIDGPPPEELDMMSPMGCQNHVVWAMAEISSLAFWKEDAQRRGQLDMPRLIDRASHIEQHLSYGSGSLSPANHVQPYTSEIFRASARVYLHSVLSGDSPSCPETQAAVDDTVRIIKLVQPLKENSASIIRSVVFGIFICGCFTKNLAQRDILLSRLTEESTRAAVGNCQRVKDLVEEIWKDRMRSPREPVRWKELLKKHCMLLV
jgi:hypothetical protein